jgi:hypothetical protein
VIYAIAPPNAATTVAMPTPAASLLMPKMTARRPILAHPSRHDLCHLGTQVTIATTTCLGPRQARAWAPPLEPLNYSRQAASVSIVLSPAKAAAFVTGSLAVATALGSGVAWLNDRFSPAVLYFVGLTIFCFGAFAIVGFLAFGRLASYYKLRHFFLYAGAQMVLALLVFKILGAYRTETFTNYFMAYFFVFAGVVPILGLSYQLDRENHKECPMCCERIRAKARICRHCGSQVPAKSYRPRRWEH